MGVLCVMVSGSVAAASAAAPVGAVTDADATVGLAGDYLGLNVGNETYYPDGRVVAWVDAGVMSLSQCPSGRFCVWSSSGHYGTVTYWTGNGVTHSISGTVGSVWNNRTNVARLYSNSGTSPVCYAPGASNSNVSTSYRSASMVNLAASTSC
jgi:hypothetical protein